MASQTWLPLERIDREARSLDPARVALTTIATVPFVLGWLLGRVWLVAAWVFTAGVVGVRAGANRG